ncbi:hypothetical protein SAMN05518801_108143 [Novosphingobium sp. CF614]|uniref:hypothetical protein n=1 Tax=Novosphingobium sp. CF614 TaxID=1884364 RepID=UPI0008E65813|nr:hypothetical protein [Novosphingobium sp. CF614]SFG15549.1 hypothetical protein SAMN05518801_108143 [Novosphingobium sp. CF614]
MFKSIFGTVAATLAILPAVAHAGEAHEFSHEGVNYAYTAEQKDGVTVIKGRTSAGEPFRLAVKGNRVTGTFDDHYVSFTKADVARLTARSAD